MSENPLKQYFRIPAVSLRLPSGGSGYSPDEVEMPESGELPVYPMTAIDEMRAKTPDALFNGTAVAAIIQSCVPAIKNPNNITTIDLDAILVAIRMASTGNRVEIEVTCPECSEQNKFDVDMNGMMNSLKPGNYDQLLKINDISIKFKPLTYGEVNDSAMTQYTIEKTMQNILQLSDDDESKAKMLEQVIQDVNVKTNELVAKTIESISVPGRIVTESEYITEFLLNCDRRMNEQIRTHSFDLASSSKIKPLSVTCPSCSHKFSQPFSLNVSDFFV